MQGTQTRLPIIEPAIGRAEDIGQVLFPTIMPGDDSAIEAVWIRGKARLAPWLPAP